MNKTFILITLLFLYGCSGTQFNSKWVSKKAPETYMARFNTSKGSFDIMVTRKLSPMAADRMYQLLCYHYFDHTLFYRVVPNFVAQFGDLDTATINNWEKYKVPDEPVLRSNDKGTLSFARSGKDSRGTQLYINLKDNAKLDTINYSEVIGFPPFGKVINGMDVVESLYAGYGDTVFRNFDSIGNNNRKFIHAYPKVDSIISTTLLKIYK